LGKKVRELIFGRGRGVLEHDHFVIQVPVRPEHVQLDVKPSSTVSVELQALPNARQRFPEYLRMLDRPMVLIAGAIMPRG
jgi:hypothetical protein